MYIAPFMAGIVNKMHDDLIDNPLLKEFSSPFTLELLKGLHYILFTLVAVYEPTFWLIMYVFNFTHFIVNPSSYELPYEQSLLYSYLIFIFLIKKVTFDVNKFDYLFISFFVMGVLVEPFLTRKEISILKFGSRGILTFACLFFALFSSSVLIQMIFLYWAGYFGVSTLVQTYSLFKKRFKFIKLLRTRWEELFV